MNNQNKKVKKPIGIVLIVLRDILLSIFILLLGIGYISFSSIFSGVLLIISILSFFLAYGIWKLKRLALYAHIILSLIIVLVGLSPILALFRNNMFFNSLFYPYALGTLILWLFEIYWIWYLYNKRSIFSKKEGENNEDT